MKSKVFYLGISLIVVCVVFCITPLSAQQKVTQEKACTYSASPEIQPYVDFLKTQHTSPVDYVMELFERYDVVILGERFHSELTQYDLIDQILLDPRFIENVGHVMTETGANNYTKALNNVLCGTYADEPEFDKALINILRDCHRFGLWLPSNFWKLMKTIRRVNCSEPEGRKLDITLLQPSWSWYGTENMTCEEFSIGHKAIRRHNNDLILGENANNALYEIFETSSRKKALVILNIPHNLRGFDLRWSYTAADCMMKRFPRRIANVMINNAIAVYHDGICELFPPVDGKWDAAFLVAGNRPVAFNMAGSPFAKDFYDGYERDHYEVKGKVTYGEIFDGYIFWGPYPEAIDSWGMPGLVDQDFLPELRRRLRLAGETPESLKEMRCDGVWEGKNLSITKSAFETEADERMYDSIVKRHLILIEKNK